MHTINDSCRVCGGRELTRFLELGPQPLANDFLTLEQVKDGRGEKFPLDVYVCHGCWHVQLLDVVDKETLFSHYLYFSTTTTTTPLHFAEFAAEVSKEHTSNGDLIVEIGSNDGVLLAAFDPRERRILGVEPAKNVADFARTNRAIPTMSRFWTEETAGMIAADLGRAKVIISNNVIGHINDLRQTTRAVKTLLEPSGLWIWEVPYLVDLLEKTEFDTVYHEHLSYFAVGPAMKMLELGGLVLKDVRRFPIHGGTIRLYAAHSETAAAPSERVKELVALEKRMKLDTVEPYISLANRVRRLRDDLNGIIRDLRAKGMRIAGYGAPAKGNTLLNYCGIGSGDLE
jgi:hypothetical protein